MQWRHQDVKTAPAPRRQDSAGTVSLSEALVLSSSDFEACDTVNWLTAVIRATVSMVQCWLILQRE